MSEFLEVTCLNHTTLGRFLTNQLQSSVLVDFQTLIFGYEKIAGPFPTVDHSGWSKTHDFQWIFLSTLPKTVRPLVLQLLPFLTMS